MGEALPGFAWNSKPGKGERSAGDEELDLHRAGGPPGELTVGRPAAEAGGLLAPERREKIAALVRQNKSVLVKDLCRRFSVSGETIRKDLASLEEAGLLIKTYGGAYIREGVKNEVYASIREGLLTEVKESIGQVCAALVQRGDTLFLDASTTCLAIARALLERDDITILTHSLQIAQLYADGGAGKLILTGGELDQKNQCFTGPIALEMVDQHYADLAFVSCQGLSRTEGVTDGSSEIGHLRRLMLQHSARRCLAVDKTKLDHSHFFRICHLNFVQTVILDTLEEPDWREYLQAQGVAVLETMPLKP